MTQREWPDNALASAAERTLRAVRELSEKALVRPAPRRLRCLPYRPDAILCPPAPPSAEPKIGFPEMRKLAHRETTRQDRYAKFWKARSFPR